MASCKFLPSFQSPPTGPLPAALGPRDRSGPCAAVFRLPSLQEGRRHHSGKAGGGKGSSIPSAFSPASKDPKDPNFQNPSRGSAVAVADPDSLLMAVCFLLLVKASWAWLPLVQPPSLSPANFDFTASTTTLLWMAPQIFPPAIILFLLMLRGHLCLKTPSPQALHV